MNQKDENLPSFLLFSECSQWGIFHAQEAFARPEWVSDVLLGAVECSTVTAATTARGGVVGTAKSIGRRLEVSRVLVACPQSTRWHNTSGGGLLMLFGLHNRRFGWLVCEVAMKTQFFRVRVCSMTCSCFVQWCETGMGD